MATATGTPHNNGSGKTTAAKTGTKPAGSKATNGKSANKANSRKTAPRGNSARHTSRNAMPTVPGWLAAAMSVVGVGVAVGAGLYATRKQWMPTAHDWKNDFSAAFADDETDHDNFDQTRNAGAEAMRDHPGEEWDDVDDINDASFPASDPPSFNPGTA